MTSPSALRATPTIHVFPERVDEFSATLAVVLGDLAVEVASHREHRLLDRPGRSPSEPEGPRGHSAHNGVRAHRRPSLTQ